MGGSYACIMICSPTEQYIVEKCGMHNIIYGIYNKDNALLTNVIYMSLLLVQSLMYVRVCDCHSRSCTCMCGCTHENSVRVVS